MTTADLSAVQVMAQPKGCTIINSCRGRNRFARWCAALQATFDYLAIVCGIWTSYWIYQFLALGHQARYSFPSFFLASNCIALLTVVVFAHLHLYEANVTLLNIKETENTLRGIAIVFAVAVILFFFRSPELMSRWVAVVSPVTTTIIVLAERRAGLVLIRWLHEQGYGVRRLAVYGTTYAAQIVKIIRRNPRLGLTCAGFIGNDVWSLKKTLAESRIDAEVLGTGEELEDLVARERIDELILADPKFSRDQLLSIINRCDECGIAFSAVADLFGSYQSWFRYELVDGLPLARCRQAALSTSGALFKRVFDLVFASLLLILLSPVLLVLTVLVWLDSPGPIIFRQERVGQDGRLFRMYKFRSMRVDTPAYAASPKDPRDPRITRVGKLLRRTSLDEVPQLINVIKGDMSIVGPRPEMPFIAAEYGPLERSRLRVQPGITGLWQVSPARAEPIHKNVEYDLFYIEHQNVFLDLAILIYTAISVIKGVGAW